MSVKFPTVPNLPGVPAVQSASTLLSTIQNGTSDALSSGVAALGQLDVGDAVGAGVSLTRSLLGSSEALGPSEAVFAEGSTVLSGVRGSVANASTALSALGSGDLVGAKAAAERLVDAASSAYDAVSSIINPPRVDPSAASDDALEADLMNQWGLYNAAGQPAAPCDTVSMFENTLDARIAEYPVENGGFASYNKVIMPYEIRAVMLKGGAVEERQEFLKAVQDAWQSTELFTFVTPECVYIDVNVIGVRQARQAEQNNGLMALDVMLKKVRQTATLAFTDTKEPSGKDSVSQGSVQPKAPEPVQQYAGEAK